MQGVVQRAYNAFAVRVQDTSLPTPGGGVKGGGGTGAGTRRVVPASESSEGMLCIEMRIRLYDDGAMSKLLEKLANVSLRFVYTWSQRRSLESPLYEVQERHRRLTYNWGGRTAVWCEVAKVCCSGRLGHGCRLASGQLVCLCHFIASCRHVANCVLTGRMGHAAVLRCIGK